RHADAPRAVPGVPVRRHRALALRLRHGVRAGAAAGCLPGDNARRLLPRRRAGDPTADAGGGGAGVRAAYRARDRRDLSNTAAIGRRRSRRPRRQPRPLHLGGRSERRGGARPCARVPRSRGVPDLPHRRGRPGTRDVSRRQALRPQTRYGRVLRTAQRRRMSTLDWLIVAGYFAAIAALTSWVMKRRRDTTADYFLASRHLGWFIVGASIFASNIGSEQIGRASCRERVKVALRAAAGSEAEELREQW